jgi:hypothetical protein
MPILRYFVFVGSALLALLLVVNAYLPKPEAPVEQAAQTSFNHNQIRITSNRVADKPIIFDTTQPTIVPPPQVAQAVTSVETKIADARTGDAKTSDAKTSDAMAQMNSTSKPAVTKPKPKPRKIARHEYPTRQYYQYPNRQTAWAQPMFPSLFGSW